MFGEPATGEKPYSAWLRVREDRSARKKIRALLAYLCRLADECPEGAKSWTDEAELAQAVAGFEPVP